MKIMDYTLALIAFVVSVIALIVSVALWLATSVSSVASC